MMTAVASGTHLYKPVQQLTLFGVCAIRGPRAMPCRAVPCYAARRRHAPHPAPAVIHCFTGSAQELREFLDLGLYIGITGWWVGGDLGATWGGSGDLGCTC